MNQAQDSEVPFEASFALNSTHLAEDGLLQLCGNSTHGADRTNCYQFISHVPDHPNEKLYTDSVNKFLHQELATTILDQLYPRLWAVARRSGSHIDPLHRNSIRGRAIIPAEDPQLHLVFHHDKIYIKPVPIYLFNHQFWATYLCGSAKYREVCRTLENSNSNIDSGRIFAYNRAAAIGFMRSYSFLVIHHLDFKLAKQYNLIPVEIDWVKWSQFIAPFRDIDDQVVSKRYHFGQFRVSRLNWLVRILQPAFAPSAWFYHIPHWSIEVYLNRCITPFFFAFACLSLALSAMQVALTIPAKESYSLSVGEATLQAIYSTSWGLSISVLIAVTFIWVLILLIPTGVLLWQFSWGFANSRLDHGKLSKAKSLFEGDQTPAVSV